jgi:hypothetical protein|tara:strand:- start:4337 stop:6412 length:2076 start_codon:yes stop_codon:yes gene_type:complete
MADPIQQQKDIFSKVQGLMAFLDATDKQRTRENLDQWKQTFAALKDITNNPLPFLLDLLKSLKSHKENRIKFKRKGYSMSSEKRKGRKGTEGDGIFKKTKKAFSTRFGLSTSTDPWLRQLDQIIRTSMLEVLPRVDDILFEELLKAFNCDMSMMVPVVGDGLIAPLQIDISQVDLLKQLKNDPGSAVGKYMYEQSAWTTGYPPGTTPFSTNRFLRDLYNVTPGVVQTIYGSSGRPLFDITALAGVYTISPYYRDQPGNPGTPGSAPITADAGATKFTFVEFLKDYFDSVTIVEIQNILGALMEVLSGFMSVRNESFSIEDALGLQKFMSAVENMLESCDGADLSGPNSESVNYLSELYDDDSFFEFNVEEERNISLEVERKSKNVLSLVSCGQVDIPVDNDVIDEGCDQILATSVRDEQLKAFDLVLQKAASSSASKAGYDISLGSISLPVEIDFKENLIKKLPQILTYCILSPKAILPVVITSRLLNQNGALATNIELFGKLFKRVIIRVVKEFLARVARHILVLVKNILLRLIRDLIKRKLDAINKKKIRLIRRLLDILLPLIIALQNATSCKEIYNIILGVLAANMPDIPFGVPPFLLAASKLKPGSSNLGTFEKFIGQMEAAGLPVGDMPDGSSNLVSKAFFMYGDAFEKERIDNEKVKISIMYGQTLHWAGPGLLKPGTTGDGSSF